MPAPVRAGLDPRSVLTKPADGADGRGLRAFEGGGVGPVERGPVGLSQEDELVVALENATLGYGPRVVLRGVSLAVRRGDFLALVGPNGSGKTTILRAMLGLLRPKAGRVVWGPCETAVRFGYVPQHAQLDEFYPLTALEVVAMGAWGQVGWLKPWGRGDARRMAERALEIVNARELAPLPYRELSGGQKQRVLVARALATGARTLVLDEPTNDLDLASEHELMEVLARLHREQGLTVVMVSHLLHVVLSYARRIAILHEGKLRVLEADELGDGRVLGEIYKLPVKVLEWAGRRAVVVGEGDE